MCQHSMLAVPTPFGRLVVNIIYNVGGTNFSEKRTYDGKKHKEFAQTQREKS